MKQLRLFCESTSSLLMKQTEILMRKESYCPDSLLNIDNKISIKALADKMQKCFSVETKNKYNISKRASLINIKLLSILGVH